MPTVSVVMSAYNHESFIKESLDSVLSQTFQDFEIIIFDDCSTDKTFDIIKSYKDARIKYFKSPYNRGMVQNVNDAINLSKGKYIANLNSDDYWEPSKLKEQVDFLDKNLKYGAVFTKVNLINELSKDIDNKFYPSFFNVENKNRYEWLNHFFYKHNSLCYTSVLTRKECYDKVGLYDPAYIVLLDLDMWTRICMAGYEIHILDSNLTNFRITNKELNLSRQNSLTRSSIELEHYIGRYLEIRTCSELQRIFPKYKNSNMSDNNIQYCVLDIIISDYSDLSSIRIKNKGHRRVLRRLAHLKEFALRFMYHKISTDPEALKILKDDFHFDFKEYLKITQTSGINGRDIGSKYKPIIRNILKAYCAISALYIMYSMLY